MVVSLTRTARSRLVIPEAGCGYPQSILTMVVTDSGLDASHRPGMTGAERIASLVIATTAVTPQRHHL
jgi:hypothetical protein